MAALGRGGPGLGGWSCGDIPCGDPRALGLDLGEAAFFLVGSAAGVAPGVLAVCLLASLVFGPWLWMLHLVCWLAGGMSGPLRAGGPWFRLVLRRLLLLVCWRYVRAALAGGLCWGGGDIPCGTDVAGATRGAGSWPGRGGMSVFF